MPTFSFYVKLVTYANGTINMTPIQKPELPKLIVNGSGNKKYVFTYKNHWDKELKRSVRSKGDSQSVGKYIPVEGEVDGGEIIFNEAFKEQYPELDYWRVFRYKGGRLEFRPIDDEICQAVRAQSFERLHAGATWALNQIMANSPVVKALEKTFSDRHTHLRLLSLAYYLVINRDSSLCNYEEFAECTWLPYGRALTSGSISRLLKKIDKNAIAKYLKHLNAEYRKAQGSHIGERQFWALDSTSITSYSDNIASVEYGHNKDLINAPQTNVLLVVDQASGMPVYYRNFDGNVNDVSTIRNTLAEMAMMDIDLDNVTVVTDKGYGSSANWDDMLRNGMSFICNTRRNLNAAISEIVDENYSELLNWNNGISFINQSAVTVPLVWCYDEFPVEGKRQQKKAKKTLYIHIYYSEPIRDELTNRLRTMLYAAVEQHRTDKTKLTEQQKKTLETYADTNESGNQVKINMHKVNKTLRLAGVRVLVSDSIKNPLQCCIAYEERNKVEYAFNTLKSRLNCNRTLTHSTEAWEGKLFLQMLASSISTMVRSRVKLYNDSAKQGKYRVHYDSDHKLLAKLNNIYLTKFKAGWMFDEIAGKRKELFQILNVPVPSVEKVMNELMVEGDDQEDRSDWVDPCLGNLEDQQEEL